MKKLTIEQVKKISPKVLLKLINRAKNYIKNSKPYKNLCKDHSIDIDFIDLVPIRFGDLDTSARTDHGVITLSYKLLCDGDFFKDYSYIIHELDHFCFQCFGDEPTQGSNEGSYLDNPFEEKAFKRQIEYIDDQFGGNEADNYVENLLDHHDVNDDNEREDKKETLMELVNEK